MTLDDLHTAWHANNAINLEMLAKVTDEDLDLKPGKGKTIRSNFVHMIGVRRAWCEERLRQEILSLPKPDWKSAGREELRDGLMKSAEAIDRLFEKLEASAPRGKWNTALFFAYAVAHEADHRAQIELALRLNGREPEDAWLYGLWDWPKMAAKSLEHHPPAKPQ